jgi:hypothetical protein
MYVSKIILARAKLIFSGYFRSGSRSWSVLHAILLRKTNKLDDYLLRYESGMRKAENDIRRQARNALAREGIIATEGEIRKWRDQNKDIVDRAEPAEPVR